MTRTECMFYGVCAFLVAALVIVGAAGVLRSAYDEGYNTGWRCSQAHGEYYECKREAK